MLRRRAFIAGGVGAFVVLMATPPLGAQPAPAPAESIRQAMAPFVRLAGCWRGEGSMRMGPGEPLRTVGMERIEMKLDGLVATIDGKFQARGADGALGRVVHQAFGVISVAPEGGFVVKAFIANGQSAEVRGEWKDGKFSWSPPAGEGRRVRYVADWSVENQWHEIGEVSLDGTTWMPFLEMKLERQPSEAACEEAPAAAG